MDKWATCVHTKGQKGKVWHSVLCDMCRTKSSDMCHTVSDKVWHVSDTVWHMSDNFVRHMSRKALCQTFPFCPLVCPNLCHPVTDNVFWVMIQSTDRLTLTVHPLFDFVWGMPCLRSPEVNTIMWNLIFLSLPLFLIVRQPYPNCSLHCFCCAAAVGQQGTCTIHSTLVWIKLFCKVIR